MSTTFAPSVLQTIGNTPLVKLNKIVPWNCADIYVKLEYFNPTGSYKDRMALSIVEEALTSPRLRVAGFVIDTIDKIMHGMQLGTAGMHNQARQWTTQGFLAQLLDLFLEKEFVVFLTSDHGNIEAQGCGRPTEGAVADLRGERVRVYPDQALRTRVQERFPNAIAWPPLGLPEDYLPLLAPGRLAFILQGERIVGHGGISLEELVVPFVRIERVDI